jgi:hypothetical protein
VTPTPAPIQPSQADLEAAIEWTVAFDEEHQETKTTLEIVELYRSSQIAADTFIWREGMDTWSTPLEIPEIRRALEASGQSPHISAPPGGDPEATTTPTAAAATPTAAAATPTAAAATPTAAASESKIPSAPPSPPSAPPVAHAGGPSLAPGPVDSSQALQDAGDTSTSQVTAKEDLGFAATMGVGGLTSPFAGVPVQSKAEEAFEPRLGGFSPFSGDIHESLPPADRTGAEPLVPAPTPPPPGALTSEPPSGGSAVGPDSLHKISLAPPPAKSRPWLVVLLIAILLALGLTGVRVTKQPAAAWKLYERQLQPLENRLLGR